MPAMDYRAAAADAERTQAEIEALNAEFSRCAASIALIEGELARLTRKLQDIKIKGTAQEAAEGSLVVLEGWAEEDKSKEVDALLEEYDGVESLEGNVTLKDPTVFKGVIDEGYLKAFLANTYEEKTSVNRDSLNNILRGITGQNLQGTIQTKVGMFFNRYPAANVSKFFGAMKDFGAQKIQ